MSTERERVAERVLRVIEEHRTTTNPTRDLADNESMDAHLAKSIAALLREREPGKAECLHRVFGSMSATSEADARRTAKLMMDKYDWCEVHAIEGDHYVTYGYSNATPTAGEPSDGELREAFEAGYREGALRSPYDAPHPSHVRKKSDAWLATRASEPAESEGT